MGGAILAGLVRQGFPFERVRVTTATTKADTGSWGSKVEYRSLEDYSDANSWAIEDADIVLVGVKPHYVLALLSEIVDDASAGAVLVSVAAGVTISQMEKIWRGPVIRTMPNTPAHVGKGVTGVVLGSRASHQDRELVVSMLDTVGDVLVVPEESINALSAISGSGPAYVYFFIERFMEAAKSHGFTEEQARTMVVGTFQGAMDLLQESGKTPQTLRDEVTSPGGSTAAALVVLGEADLTSIIKHATDHAIKRATELSGK
jgi:pyrroline-5-carboxylate reductase